MYNLDTLRTIFTPIYSYLTATSMTRDEAIDSIATFAKINPSAAFALTSHLADITEERQIHDTHSINFAPFLAEAYFRAFFNPHTAAMHGTNYFDGDIDQLREFTSAFLVNDSMDSRITHVTKPNIN